MLTGNLCAQVPNLKFKHLTINQGLSQNTVFCIYQDSKGFIWIGTEDGLNRYDGYNFLIFKHENNNPHSISNNQINGIAEDADGNLWVATSDGLNFYNRNLQQFSKLKLGKDSIKNHFISSVISTESGQIWAGTRRGLKSFDSKSREMQNSYDVKGGVDVANKNKITGLFSVDEGKIWVNTANGLKLFDTRKKLYIDLPAGLKVSDSLINSHVRAIKKDRKGNYWFGTETGGVYLFNDNFSKSTHFSTQSNPSLPSNVVRDIFLSGTDEVWIGTREGLAILDSKNQEITTYQHQKYDGQSLSHNSVRKILRDNAGNLWLGTYAGGVNVFNKSSLNFQSIGEKKGDLPGLNDQVVSSLLKDKNSLWIGTEGGGLNALNLLNGKLDYYLPGSKLANGTNIVKSLALDGKGNLWLGTFDGISIFNLNNHQFSQLKINNKIENNGSKQIHALIHTADGMYAASNGGGLYFFGSNGEQKFYRQSPKNSGYISSNNLTTLIQVGNLIWVGTQRGLNSFSPDNQKFVQYLHDDANKNSISNNSVISLFKDRQSRLWVGTEGGGLNLFDSEKNIFYSVGSKQGIANDVIHAITQDDKGNLWLSTNNGLSMIDAGSLHPPFAEKTLKIKSFNVTDGLQGNQFSSSAVAKLANGNIYFGGINGISYFNPDRLILNKTQPKVVFTGFYIKNKEIIAGTENSPLKKQIGETNQITLNYDQANISIKYAALSYVNPEKNTYSYKLDGLDEEWNEVGNLRIASYTNLDPGTYKFMVKAANNDGVWSSQITTLKITVLPPFWKTWWAYLIYVALFVFFLYLYYLYSIRTVKLKNDLAFEYQSHQKDLELNKQKLNFFTNISHEIKTPLTLILAPLEKLIGANKGNNKLQNQLLLMQRNGDRLVRLINQLLDFRRFESGHVLLSAAEGNIVRFIKEIVLAFNSYAKQLDLTIRVNATSPSIHLWFDRDKFEKIIYNLLSNALKFTPAKGEVIIAISERILDNIKQVVIEVSDNGLGISERNLAYIFDEFSSYNQEGTNYNGTGIGLYFTKSLVEMHHGTITVTSKPRDGEIAGSTCFTITVPMGKEHLRPEEIDEAYLPSEDIVAYATIPAGDVHEDTPQIVYPDTAQIMLVVEDNPDVRAFISRHFAEAYIVHTALNGREGFEKALELIPDIIISDVMMPEMSGTELCAKIKTTEATSHIPVVLLTARTPLIFKIEGLETGADDYITKPFSLKVLETRVSNLLELRRKLKERYSREINLEPTNLAITSPDEKFLEKVMKYIEQNLDEPSLNVEELGKEVGMSRVTLYRKIKGLTNQTAVEFIRTIKLKRAAQILIRNEFQINEIAYMVGFTDVNYFRKCFKQYFNATPREYVQKHKGTA